MDQNLRVFVEVVEKKNFSKAAKALYMTQPAVSQYIRSFEEELGVQLFERTNRYVEITKGGEIVYQHAKEILGHYKTMNHLLNDLYHEPQGELKIGASYTFGEYVLPRIIAKLRESYPKIHPTITIGNTTEIAKQVASMHLDIGMVEGEVHESTLVVETIATDQMEVVASKEHSLTQATKIERVDLEKETWILREEGSGTREATENMFQKLAIQPKSFMEFGSTQIIKESVEAGLGISLLSLWTIRKELAMGSLAIINESTEKMNRPFSVVLKNMPIQTKATKVFKDLLTSYLKNQ